MPTAQEIARYLDTTLGIAGIPDRSVNGLQVDNETTISRIGLAVDASRETFEKAVESNCQMLVVHHGLLWGETGPLVGILYRRIKYNS